MPLDKSRSYDEIFGITPDDARFVQDGIRYNAHGVQVGEEPGWVGHRAAPVVAKPKPVKTMGRAAAALSHDRENRNALRAEDLSE